MQTNTNNKKQTNKRTNKQTNNTKKVKSYKENALLKNVMQEQNKTTHKYKQIQTNTS